MAKKHTLPTVNKPKKPEAYEQLVYEERVKLINMLNDPVMQKALANVSTYKPTVFCLGAGEGALRTANPKMAVLCTNNRLHEIRGWEQFETALALQTKDPLPQRKTTPETYPDTARP